MAFSQVMLPNKMKVFSRSKVLQNNFYRRYMKKSDNFYHTDTITPDVIFHSKHANNWWNKKTLLDFNDVRIPFIRDTLSYHQTVKSNEPDDDVNLRNVTILDVGCGGGILAESLARLHANVTGIDPSVSLIDAAIKHATYDNQLDHYLKYEASSIHDFCIPNVGKFDAVVISEVLEHIDEKEKFLQSCLNCIKPRGSLIITTPNKTLLSKIFVVNLAERFGIIPLGTHDFDKFISPEELKPILEKYGCTITESQGFKYNPLTRKFSYSNFETLMYALHALKSPQ